MYPHFFRLRGTWDYEVLSGEAATPRGRIKLPGNWGAGLGGGFRGRVRYRRVFHRPSNLDPHERVWLVCEGMNVRGVASCNGRALGAIGEGAPCVEFEITPLLADPNELVLELELPPMPAGEVRLEVRQPQFLADWNVWLEPADGGPVLRFEGRVAGEPLEEPLELVVRTAEAELIYASVTVGSPISLSSPARGVSSAADSASTVQLDVRLIRGGTRIWEARRTLEVGTAARPDR